MNITEQLLKTYRSKYGDFRVAFKDGYGFWRHLKYSEISDTMFKSEVITDRMIFPDEIIYETDMNMRKMNYGEAKKKTKKLRNYGISYTMWFTTNKSYHIHMIFPELNLINDDYDKKIIKDLFILWLYDWDKEDMARHKVDTQLSGKHLIRLEHSYKIYPSKRKFLVDEHEAEEDNLIPNEIWMKFNNLNKYKPSTTKKFDYQKIPDGIKYFLTHKFKDGRHRMGFAIYQVLKQSPLKNQAKDILIEWNKMQGSHLREHELRSIIKNEVNYKIGSRYIENLRREVKYDGKMDSIKTK